VAYETVHDHSNGNKQDNRLQHPASVTGAQQRTGDGDTQQVK
jgi:hypothetical protein